MDNFAAILKNFDITPFDLGAIIFFALTFILFIKSLNVFFIKPFSELLAARESATSGREREIIEKREFIENLEIDFNQQLQQARKEAELAKSEIIFAARKKATEIVDRAQKEGERLVSEGRRELSLLEPEYKQALNAQLQSLAELASQKILGEFVGE
ncbi:MAG TPA: hypothetical protein PKD37_02480 [Oligoflexia bacterium]|nr:hypothetical protein [Oligoflexia bacterium]HMP26837.1 hypothetical protein [Oligoflexia bacterium]